MPISCTLALVPRRLILTFLLSTRLTSILAEAFHLKSQSTSPTYTHRLHYTTSPPRLQVGTYPTTTTTRGSTHTKNNNTRHNMSDPPRKKYETLLFDMDGVLAEVSKSYRAAIVATCHTYGATSVNEATVTEYKARGNANDDWKLSFDLIQNDPLGQKNTTLEQVTETFEKFYQGDGDTPGLYTLETLIPTRATLDALKKRSKPGIGIVTGRPRKDCMKFLKQYNLEDLIDVTYCMEDGPSKPDPFPCTRACQLLGVEPSKAVVLIGDTPDDMNAALSAGCSAVGVSTPEAVAEQDAKGEPHTLATLSVIMKSLGADHVLPPGFAELVDMFSEE